MTKQQKLNIELIKLSHHNDLDGKKVADDLISNKKLWISVYGYFINKPLISLRDMNNYWHIDCIGILCKNENKEQIEKLADQWFSTSITSLNKNEMFVELGNIFDSNQYSVIEVLWD